MTGQQEPYDVQAGLTRLRAWMEEDVPEPRHCAGCRGFTATWQYCHGLDLAGITLEDVVTEWARCNLDGRPASPGDAKILADFAATLDACATSPGLRWRELMEDDTEFDYGPYWREWYCPPPPSGQPWRVVSGGDEWYAPGIDGRPVRRIYEIEVADAPEAAGNPAERDGPAGPGPGAPAGTGPGRAGQPLTPLPPETPQGPG